MKTIECSLHIQEVKAAVHGSFVAHHIPKCIVALLSSQKREWIDSGWDKLQYHQLPANDTQTEAEKVYDGAGHF